jgi:hypothetical protein
MHSEPSSKVCGGWRSDFQKPAFSKGKSKLNKENLMTLNLSGNVSVYCFFNISAIILNFYSKVEAVLTL